LEHADANQDYETVALLVGNASWLLALMGRLREAATVGGLLRSVPPTEDWYSFRTLAVLVNRGNTQLVAEDVVSMPLTTRAPRVGADIGRLFATRSEILRQEAIGEKENQGALLATLALLVGNGKHLWAALFGLEVTSLATSRDVHELLWMSSQQMRGRGVVSVGGAAARARLDGDGVRLVECAQHLEWAELHALALRVSADAARLLAPHTEQGTRARAAVLRARREFDGRDPRWLEDVDHLPTPRQMDVVWKVVDGATASDVAAELVLSPRTVENHLHRVYATLGVHGRDELVDILRPPPRPPGWHPGEF
jgi:DNA-binding CsgD family transcriptional regulator